MANTKINNEIKSIPPANKKTQRHINYLRERAEELVEVHASWRAFFLGKRNAREHAGYFDDELKAIKEQVLEDKQAYLNRKRCHTDPAPYLHRRAKQLAIVDTSWKASCFFFGKMKAREDAGFTQEEIIDIRRQRTIDYENNLKNPDYLRKRAKQLAAVDKSWKAYFYKKDDLRAEAGFKTSEIRAIEQQIQIDKALAAVKRNTYSLSSSISSYFFKSDAEKEKNERKQRINQLKDKHQKRKEEIEFRKTLPMG